jgi:ABC-type glycerol-3-phosphate transport system substrate-binding protein
MNQHQGTPGRGRVTLLALAIISLLAGCAGGQWVTASELLSGPERQIIVLWHTFTGAEAKAIETLADQFNAENPWKIALIVEYQEELLEKLRAAPARRPDLVTVWPKDIATYVEVGLVGAAPTASDEMREVWADLLPMAAALYRVDGTPQALPLGLATYLTYYNSEWLADLGWGTGAEDWEAFRRTMCAATDPLQGRVGLGVPARSSILMAFLAASGSNIMGQDGYYQFSDEPGLAAAGVLHNVLGVDCGAVYEDRDEGLAELGRSSMSMILESSEYLSEIERAILDGRNFTLGVSPLPGPEGPGPTLWYGPGLMVSAPEGERQEAALRAMSWFLSPEAQELWGSRTAFLPVRRSVVQAALDETVEGMATTPEARLWQLALEVSDSGAWVAWPQPTNRMACRASLLRGLLALQREDADANAYIGSAVTACNTGVGFRQPATPTPSPDEAP